MSRTVLDEPNLPRLPFALGIHSDPIGVASSDDIEALSSPEEDGIKKSLVIDMKDLVGDAVGNVRSICPNLLPLNPNVDEHRSLIPRLSPCCVRSLFFASTRSNRSST